MLKHSGARQVECRQAWEPQCPNLLLPTIVGVARHVVEAERHDVIVANVQFLKVVEGKAPEAILDAATGFRLLRIDVFRVHPTAEGAVGHVQLLEFVFHHHAQQETGRNAKGIVVEVHDLEGPRRRSLIDTQELAHIVVVHRICGDPAPSERSALNLIAGEVDGLEVGVCGPGRRHLPGKAIARQLQVLHRWWHVGDGPVHRAIREVDGRQPGGIKP
mmetsp:Transcript_29707/g.98430  ORF Transcript_29707/g.98430 Transcript_29707/m.98430 type:complete len:217 (+) Transcript_29707:1950-2600(+)